MVSLKLNLSLGQHLLINKDVIKKMVELIPSKVGVIEIGAGKGEITEALLKKNCQVVAIEIDKQFAPFLDLLRGRYSGKLEVIYDDALKQNWQKLTGVKREKVWLIGSLPYHITEPLMATIAGLPIKGAVFLVGKRFALEIQAEKDSSYFGKLTLLVNTFFRPEVISQVDKSCFYPKPRTNSAIIFLAPREEADYENEALFLLRELILGARRSPKIKNALREALIKYRKVKGNKMTKNEARVIIDSFGLPETILNKPLEQLNNQELKELFQGLTKKFDFPLK